MRFNARLFLLLLPLILLLSGCPTIKLGAVSILDGSVKGSSFTLTAKLTVQETDETEGEDKTPTEGRGLLTLSLPQGWKITGARVQSPHESAVRTLVPAPQAAVAHAETFPLEPGEWWSFVSNKQSVPQGTWDYEVQFDVEAPKKTKGGTIGLSAGIFNENMEDLVAPTKFDVALKGRKGTLTPLAPPAASNAEPTPEPEPAPTEKASGG